MKKINEVGMGGKVKNLWKRPGEIATIINIEIH